MGAICCFFPAILMSSTYTDKNNVFLMNKKRHSQFGTLSLPSSNRTTSNCLSHNNPANGWPFQIRSRGTTGSSMIAQDFCHLCRGRRIHTSGHSDYGILRNPGGSCKFTWEKADTASAACPSQSGKLAITATTFAAVIRGRRRALFGKKKT